MMHSGKFIVTYEVGWLKRYGIWTSHERKEKMKRGAELGEDQRERMSRECGIERDTEIEASQR